MNVIQQSETIRAGLRKGFQDGTSKVAQRRCYGYDTGPDGELVINPDEAAIVYWIFDQYLSGNSLGTIAAGLEKKGILSPTGKAKWNREALNKLLSNEKYTGRVLLQKTVSTGTAQIKYDGLMDRYLYTDSHEAIISDEMFQAVQQEKLNRVKNPETIVAGLEKKGVLSPTGKAKWNREALNKLLSNEKYTERVLLQKTVSTGTTQIKNDGLMDRYLYTDSHEAIISDEMFQTVQQKKLSRAKNPENMVAMDLIF